MSGADLAVLLAAVPAGAAGAWLWGERANRYLASIPTSEGGGRSLSYRVLGLVSVLALVVAALRLGAVWGLVLLFVLFPALVVVSGTDLLVYRIPNQITFPTLAVLAAAILVIGIADDDLAGVGRALLGSVIFSGMLFVIWIAVPAGMGFGDVKLALPMGAVTGWLGASRLDGISQTLVAVALGAVLGVLAGLALGVLRKITGRDLLADPEAQDAVGERAVFKTTFPFGPALAAGTAVVCLFAGSFGT